MVTRKLHPELLEYFDKKLIDFPKEEPRALFIAAAKSLKGVREKTGKNDGRMVELIQETIGAAMGEPWCMSFVQSCLAYAEVKTGIISDIFASEHCLTVWNNTSLYCRVKYKPLPGAIVLWQKIGSSQGHAAILEDYNHPYRNGETHRFMFTIEGNTSGFNSNKKIVREGDGIYECERSISSTKTMRLLGFLKPF